MNRSKISLGVNIDHVATLRQARYREASGGPLAAEPDPLVAALAAEIAGAAGITLHLREDRRHIQDQDFVRLREGIATKLNLEMGNSPEILQIALKVGPEDVCLVPENRQEVTTEGGLDCIGGYTVLFPTIHSLRSAGICVSMFIAPDLKQVEAAARIGAEFVELHTGAFANAQGLAADMEWDRLVQAAQAAHEIGLGVNAGHGINYSNIWKIVQLPHLHELNIGHSIIARSILVGMEKAVREMLELMQTVS
jgi:pyridoxine 5-phosphate synthase